MNDRNEVFLIGKVFGEPRVGKTKTGGTVAQFSVCVRRPEPSKSSDIINVVAWDSVAEEVSVGFNDGTGIQLKGRIQKTSYISQDGTRRSNTKVYAQEIERTDENRKVLPVSDMNGSVEVHDAV